MTLFHHSLTQISFPHPIFADDQLLGLEEVENMLQDEETGDQGVDAVGFQLEDQVAGGLFSAGEEFTETVQLFSCDAVTGFGASVIILDHPESGPGGTADAYDQRLRSCIYKVQVDRL